MTFGVLDANAVIASPAFAFPHVITWETCVLLGTSEFEI